jgi:hypothetical protein
MSFEFQSRDVRSKRPREVSLVGTTVYTGEEQLVKLLTELGDLAVAAKEKNAGCHDW